MIPPSGQLKLNLKKVTGPTDIGVNLPKEELIVSTKVLVKLYLVAIPRVQTPTLSSCLFGYIFVTPGKVKALDMGRPGWSTLIFVPKRGIGGPGWVTGMGPMKYSVQ